MVRKFKNLNYLSMVLLVPLLNPYFRVPTACLATDRVILGVREVVSAPLSANFTLPETSGSPYISGSPCVSVPVLTVVGVDTGSRNTGPGSGFLKGVLVIVSNRLRKEGRTKGLGMATEMGSGVGPEGGPVGNSLIRSTVGSSGPICIVSIWAGGAGVIISNACLSSSSSSLSFTLLGMPVTTALSTIAPAFTILVA